MIRFEYDDNGNLIVYKNGEKIGKITTIADMIEDEQTARGERANG